MRPLLLDTCAILRLADEPVKSLRGERGLMYMNGKAMVIEYRKIMAVAAVGL